MKAPQALRVLALVGTLAASCDVALGLLQGDSFASLFLWLGNLATLVAAPSGRLLGWPWLRGILLLAVFRLLGCFHTPGKLQQSRWSFTAIETQHHTLLSRGHCSGPRPSE